MKKRETVARHIRRYMIVCALLIFTSLTATAQQGSPTPLPSPSPQAKPSLESQFFKNILSDQRAIWTSPFHIDGDDAKWAVPLGLSTAALIATDRHTAGDLIKPGDNSYRLRISRDISRAGNFYTTGGVALGFYLVGRAAHNERARETGLLGAEALIDSTIVVEALKAITQRPRPPVDNASGEFFDGGASFPSGHAISAWTMATVVAYEYGHKHPLVYVGAYGIATAVSISRFTGSNHFLSDVLIGSALGYGIGRYVYHQHHDPSLDFSGVQTKPRHAHSKLIPFAAPVISPGAHAYGLALAWKL